MIFVVAEIGVNWDGDFELVKEMMKHAKKSSCNAVKFQAYDENIVKDHPQKTRLMKSAISKNNIDTINDFAKSVGIEWFCTPMYPYAVELLDPYVNRFKMRELDGRNLLEGKTSELFQKILETKKELMVSSQKSPLGTKYGNHPQIKWLYCIPKYPCDVNDLDFSVMKDFDGYSNHCPHFIAPLTAATKGAKIIEVHITSDKSKDFLDNNVSFDYDELKNVLSNIRQIEKIRV